MNSKEASAKDLETELLRLNTLVRARRAQLARLERCPNKDCACRAVWREVVEKDLASQMQTIRKSVKNPSLNGSKPLQESKKPKAKSSRSQSARRGRA